MLSDRYFRTFTPQNSIEKAYHFILSNTSMVSEDDLPDKVCLEYKLNEVIQRLKDEMRKLKSDIRSELDYKSKMTLEKVDFSLLHTMNYMIVNKLYSQLRELVEKHKGQIEEAK